MCFAKGFFPFAPLDEMIEGTQHQDGVDTSVRALDLPGVADLAACDRMRRLGLRSSLGLSHMARHRIDQVNFMASPGEPKRMDARGAADVKNDGRNRERRSLDQVSGPNLLEFSRTREKTLRFINLVIVIEH